LQLVAGGWFVLREKYCWLVADKRSEQALLACFIEIVYRICDGCSEFAQIQRYGKSNSNISSKSFFIAKK
jgi:hypothetical protein